MFCLSGFAPASRGKNYFSACQAFAMTLTASPSVVNTEAATKSVTHRDSGGGSSPQPTLHFAVGLSAALEANAT